MVELEGEDPMLDVIRKIERIRIAQSEKPESVTSKYEELAALLEKGETTALLERLFDVQEVLFDANHCTVAEAEVCFYIISGLFKHLTPEQAQSCSKSFAERLTQNTQANVAQRIKILGNLYNLMEDECALRYALFCTMVKYAKATNQVDQIVQHLKHIPLWLEQWKADTAQQRELYLRVYELLEEAKSKEAHAHLIKYLGTFEKASVAELDSVLTLTTQALVKVVNSSEYFTFEAYTDMQCFQHLKTKPDTAGLLELCGLFSSGTLELYSAFVAKNGSLFSKLNVNEEECLRKMRLLAICTVGDGMQEVPYSTIQKALNMPADQVERWVIKAISAKLVDAKMDQLREVVLFSRVSQRVFTLHQWQGLNEKLISWKANVKALLQVVQKAQQDHAYQASQLTLGA